MFKRLVSIALLAAVITIVGCGPEKDIETRREVTVDVEETRTLETVIE